MYQYWYCIMDKRQFLINLMKAACIALPAAVVEMKPKQVKKEKK